MYIYIYIYIYVYVLDSISNIEISKSNTFLECHI